MEWNVHVSVCVCKRKPLYRVSQRKKNVAVTQNNGVSWLPPRKSLDPLTKIQHYMHLRKIKNNSKLHLVSSTRSMARRCYIQK